MPKKYNHVPNFPAGVLLDFEDYLREGCHHWRLEIKGNNQYAVRSVRNKLPNGGFIGKVLRLHIEIASVKFDRDLNTRRSGVFDVVKFKNGNSLDCRRGNLELSKSSRIPGFPQGVLLDLEDYEIEKKYHWYCNIEGYVRTSKKIKGVWKMVTLHREIMTRMIGRELDSREVVDHKNGSPLDNRRSNLRLVDVARNTQNRGSADIDNISCGVRGVTWNKKRKSGRHIWVLMDIDFI